MNYQHWLADSGIASVDINRWTRGTGPSTQSVAQVTLRGEYGGAHSQTESFRVLRMSISGAIRWDAYAPKGLVLEISRMDYFGGDSLLSWDDLLERDAISFAAFRVAVVCSTSNISHVLSLLQETGEEHRVCASLSLDEALAFCFG